MTYDGDKHADHSGVWRPIHLEQVASIYGQASLYRGQPNFLDLDDRESAVTLSDAKLDSGG